MTEFNGKTILVVGASGAFGSEFCRQLTALGARLIGTASSAESSVRLPAQLEQRLLLDLGNRESIQILTQYLLNSETQLDGVVLASGLVAFGTTQDTPHEVTAKLMQVNALGQIETVNQLLPKLRASAEQNRAPFILSISGVISEAPMPGLAAYSASKTALLGYAKAAAKELKKFGVRWLDARPGHTESGLATRAIFGTAPNFGAGAEVSTVIQRIIQGIANEEADLPSEAFK